MDLCSHFDYGAFSTVIILITVHRPSIRGGGELLNSERFVRCCIGVALNGPFLTPLNYTVTRYIPFEVYFLIVSIQIGQQLVIPSAGQTFTGGHTIHTTSLFHHIIHRNKRLFTYHRHIPSDQIPSHS